MTEARIMIIEDEALLAADLRRQLEGLGYDNFKKVLNFTIAKLSIEILLPTGYCYYVVIYPILLKA